jgi:hypothetical protein
MAKKKLKKFDNGGYTGQPDEPLESVYPLEEALLGGPIGKALGRGVGAIASKVDMLRRPKVINEMVTSRGLSTKSNPIRMPNDPSEITHGYRNMSQAEAEAARKSGYLEANPNAKYAEGKKWWSSGDEQGSFGRQWKGGDDAVTVRTTKNNVPANRAVKAKDLERLNPETGKFEPFKKGGKVKTKAKPTASSRGDGCAQRGKTRGRYI